jgi:hypothetical protein
MSPKGSRATYSPAPPPREPASFTIAEMKELGDYFYALFERSNIKWVIYAAGVAALLDIVQKLVLAVTLIFKFARS